MNNNLFNYRFHHCLSQSRFRYRFACCLFWQTGTESLAGKSKAAAFGPSSSTHPSGPSAFIRPCAEEHHASAPFAGMSALVAEPFVEATCKVVVPSSAASFGQAASPSFERGIAALACLPFGREPLIASFEANFTCWLSSLGLPPFSAAFSSSGKWRSSCNILVALPLEAEVNRARTPALRLCWERLSPSRYR